MFRDVLHHYGYLSRRVYPNDKAATKIAKVFRGHLVRKKYFIAQLPQKEMLHYKTFAIGNDPEIVNLAKYTHKKDKMAVVGLSGLRALWIACRLSQEKTPKIFIVETSVEVIAFWQGIRRSAADAATCAAFSKALKQFLQLQANILYRLFKDDVYNKFPTANYPNQNIPQFFMDLFNYMHSSNMEVGYQKVRKIILHVSLIRQSWADAKTFLKINNLLAYLKIPGENVVTFPSNLPATLQHHNNPNAALQVIKNNASLRPGLSIFSNLEKPLSNSDYLPTKVFLVEDYAIENVRKKLNI